MSDVVKKLEILNRDENWDEDVSNIMDRFNKEEMTYDELKEISKMVESKLNSLVACLVVS